LVDALDFLAVDELINDPFKTLATFDHVDDQLSLHLLLIPWDEVDELLERAIDSAHDSVRSKLASVSLGSDQIHFVFDVDDWDREVVHINDTTYLQIHLVILSGLE